MRDAISVMYQGNWADRVARMPDSQVAAVYQRKLNLDRINKYNQTMKEKTA